MLPISRKLSGLVTHCHLILLKSGLSRRIFARQLVLFHLSRVQFSGQYITRADVVVIVLDECNQPAPRGINYCADVLAHALRRVLRYWNLTRAPLKSGGLSTDNLPIEGMV